MLQLLFAASVALGLTPASAEQAIAWEVRSERIAATRVHRIIDAQAPFDAVALSWSGTDVSARVRASHDGVIWSEWTPAAIDEHLTDRAEKRYFTSIVHFSQAKRHLEYSLGSAEAVHEVQDLLITFFAPAEARPGPERFISENLTLGALAIRSRVDWECPDGEGSRWTPAHTTVTHAVVHHTAGANSAADWDDEVRNIWYFHTVTRGWGDIGYNYLIDPNGVIYEGRAGGPGAIGAHFSCRNTNTVGISLLGTFTSIVPTSTALDALTRLLVELSKMHRIRPDSFVYHQPTALNLPAIPGHRDANPSPQACSRTECPGDAFYAHLPIIRLDVATCPPVITAQPVSTGIPAGSAATLSVLANGSEPITYQWYVGVSGETQTPLEGSTGSTLTVSPPTTTSYWVRVGNRCGTADSETAVVVVGSPGRRRGARR